MDGERIPWALRGDVVTVRCWFGYFAAVARQREVWPDRARFAVGLPWRCGTCYGFGAEVGRA